MSRFANFRAGVREKVTTALGIDNGKGEDELQEPTAEEIEKEEEDSRRNEYRLTIILEKVRDMYYQRGLVGSVEISRSFLCTCNSISCDIDGSSSPESGTTAEEAGAAEAEAQKIPLLVKLTVRNTTRLLQRLEARAKNYRNKPYKADLSVSGSISITDPMGFTGVSISCSATLESLLKTA